MSFRLEPGEPAADGLRRIAHEQLRQSVQDLAAGAAASDDDIHSVRKAMKRMRAVVRLARAQLGREGFRLENATYRTAAASLAGLRDAAVLVATLDGLGLADTGPVRELLAARRQAAGGDGGGDAGVAQGVVAALTAADARVELWPLEAAGWDTVSAALVTGYRRGRAQFDAACWQPTTVRLHEWRKRVKYLWYHGQLLEPLWPGALVAWQAELDRLGDLLGRDHDLAILARVLGEQHAAPTAAAGALDAGTLPELLGAIGRRRGQLQAEARILGLRVYAERPPDLQRRLRAYRRAMEEEEIAGLGAGAPSASAGDPERVADTRCRAGAGPLWHADEQRLYWVDSPEGRLYRYDPATGEHREVFHGEPTGGFTVQADGSLLLFMAHGAVAVWREGEPLRRVIDEIAVERGSRFNDVIADPAGRVFCGTMPSPATGKGRLYRLDRGGALTELLDDVGVSNGMGFSPDRRHLYRIDASTQRIYRFDYDERTGELANRQVFADTADEEGSPHGMAVDAEGGVWCALWGGGCLVRYTAQGRRDRRLPVPARKVAGAGFGGPGRDQLYATTAGGPDRAAEGDGAGALFRLRAGVAGGPEHRSRIGL